MTSRNKCNNYVGRIQIFRSMQSTPFREGTLMCTVQFKLMIISFFFSIALLKFASRGDDQFVLVGVARDLVLNPRSLTGGFLYLYQLEDGGESLKLLHKTPVEDVPGAIASFQGRVLIGVGRYLRIYDIGKKKMLRKCENKVSYYVFRKKNWANYQCECIIMKILMQFYS